MYKLGTFFFPPVLYSLVAVGGTGVRAYRRYGWTMPFLCQCLWYVSVLWWGGFFQWFWCTVCLHSTTA